jgi:hypothetical protein
MSTKWLLQLQFCCAVLKRDSVLPQGLLSRVVMKTKVTASYSHNFILLPVFRNNAIQTPWSCLQHFFFWAWLHVSVLLRSYKAFSSLPACPVSPVTCQIIKREGPGRLDLETARTLLSQKDLLRLSATSINMLWREQTISAIHLSCFVAILTMKKLWILVATVYSLTTIKTLKFQIICVSV